jgi:hypothetical protein
VLSRRNSHLQFETLRDALVVTGCAALLIWGIVVAGRSSLAAKPNPSGAYKITIGSGGGAVGSGKALVNAKFVKIDATIDDGQGNTVVISAPKLLIDGSTYRFSGSGTANTGIVKISGRIDPPDPNISPKGRTLKKWRIVATYATVDGKCAGRVIGEQ